MLAHASSKNDHSSFARRSSALVQVANILYDVKYKARGAERVEIYHVPDRAIC
jgi:hypothetical protein